MLSNLSEGRPICEPALRDYAGPTSRCLSLASRSVVGAPAIGE